MLHVSRAWKAAALAAGPSVSLLKSTVPPAGLRQVHLPAGFHRIPMGGVPDADRQAECVQRVGRAGRSGAVGRGLDGGWESGT